MATDATGAESAVGRLGLAQFPNNGGLLASGQNLWTPTATSGAAIAVAQGAAERADRRRRRARRLERRHGRRIHAHDPGPARLPAELQVVQAWDDIERMANDLQALMS